jgi:hypothetical protein
VVVYSHHTVQLGAEEYVMRELMTWQRWIVALVSLPMAAIISTFIISQTQIGQLVPATMPFQHTLWTALHWSLASSIIWILWRNQSQPRQWRVIGESAIEGIGLFGVALGIGWYFELIDITWQINSESIVALIGLAIPLAWWSMAEEQVLRSEIGALLARMSSFGRDMIMLSIGWVIQTSLVTTGSIYVLVIIILTEGLSVMTWSGSANFERAWARRWAWRWVVVIGAGVSSTGFVSGTTSFMAITTNDPFALVVVVAATFAAWVSYSALQKHATE